MTDDARRQLGALGERVAADHLARRGFQILERNYRTRWGELDIVAFDGQTLVFCEVKSRRASCDGSRAPEASQPFQSIHSRKRTQVRRMAGSWLSDRPGHPFAPVLRFDAIGVVFDPSGRLVSLDHLEGAW